MNGARPQYSYIQSKIQKRQRIQRKRFIRLLLLVITIVIAYQVFNQFNKKSNTISNPASQKEGIPAVETTNISLKDAVENSLAETKGTYGIVIKSLKTDKSYSANEHKTFEAGSLYKLWVMVTAYKQIQEGKLTEDQVLSDNIATLNRRFDIDPNQAEQTKGTITLTVHDALNQMITISHNYAALLLTDKVKLSSVAAFLKENEFLESSVGVEGEAPKSTPFDIANFFEKLYKGELATQEDTDKMINLLKNQQLNEGLPKYLPDQSKVAHKTGEIGWFKHDAGIVYNEKEDYIITIMSESESPAGAQERIALVSKVVYEYFQGY